MEKDNIIRKPSQITYDYATIKITQSRIDKGLISVPVALSKLFPEYNRDIHIYLSDSDQYQTRHYTSSSSTQRENRIEGLTGWLRENNIKNNDEIVIQFIDKDNFVYRLIPEISFIYKTKQLQNDFDKSTNEDEATSTVELLSNWTQRDKSKVILSEFRRLVSVPFRKPRTFVNRNIHRARESTPANLKTMLRILYEGHCQLCDFWFLKRDNEPFFEIHHIYPSESHHPKNLLVVCGNCHNQFEYASVNMEFDDESWLTKVGFNDKIFKVNQLEPNIRQQDFYKELFL